MLKAIIVPPKSVDISEPSTVPQKSLFSNPKTSRLVSMEAELKSILLNKYMSDDQKYALYNSLLVDALQLYNGGAVKTAVGHTTNIATQAVTNAPPTATGVRVKTKKIKNPVYYLVAGRKKIKKKVIGKPNKSIQKLKKFKKKSLDDGYPSE